MDSPLRATVLRALPWIGLLIAATLPYLNSLPNEFVYDDVDRIVENRLVQELDYLSHVVTRSQRPVRDVSFALDHALWGLDPPGWHLTNIVLHALTSLLVFGLFRRLFGPSTPWLALAGALLFATHPVHVEAVTGISNRQELLAALFLLIGLLAWAWSARPRLGYCLALLALGLALGSKQTAFVAPLLYLLWDAWRDRLHAPHRNWMLRHAVFLPGPVLLIWIARRYSGMLLFEGARGLDVFYTMSWAFFEDLRRILWPWPLSADISAQLHTTADPGVVAGWLSFAALLGVVLAGWRQRRLFAFAAAAYLISWLPLSNVLPVGFVVAERYLYLPSVWWCMGAAAVLGSLPLRGPTSWAGRRARWTLASSVAISLLFSGLVARRNLDWRDAESLWRATLRTNPESFVAHYNLGLILYRQEQFTQAAHHQRQARRIRPGAPEAANNLGLSLLKNGELDDARRVLEQSLALTPAHATTQYNLACVAAAQGELIEARDRLLRLREEGYPGLRYAREDPDLAPLRASPYFAQIFASGEAITPPPDDR